MIAEELALDGMVFHLHNALEFLDLVLLDMADRFFLEVLLKFSLKSSRCFLLGSLQALTRKACRLTSGHG